MTFKIICLILLVVMAIAFMIAGKFIPEKGGDKNHKFKVVVRVRMGIFLAMLVVLFICVIIA